MNEQDFREIVALANKRDEKAYEWLRWLIALASGALAVLVTLQEKVALSTQATLCMKIAWASLGLGIVAGSFSLYGEVWKARELVKLLVRQKIDDPFNPKPLVAKPPLIIRLAEDVCYTSLLISVTTIVAYGFAK